MAADRKNFAYGLGKSIRRRMLTGLLVIFPVFVTFFVVKFIFNLLGGILSPVVREVLILLGYVPGDIRFDDFIITSFALALTFALLYFIGVFTTNFIGRFVLGFVETVLHNTPLISDVYKSSKKLIERMSLPERTAFKRVVIVEFPRVGMKVISFVTGGIKFTDGTELTSVFIPTTPNPASGFLIYLPESDIVDTNITVEDGIKLVVSGNILAPEEIGFISRGVK
ncbi:MAG: DUF502 domain-containing protein [Planctomycetes bacterium]|nr:DUF502 domain-containing protein [Planctomycetota bacterium]